MDNIVNITLRSAGGSEVAGDFRKVGTAAGGMASEVKNANAAMRQSAGGIGGLRKAVAILTRGMGSLGDVIRGVFTGGIWAIGASLVKGAFDLIKGAIDENREQLENYRQAVAQSLDNMAQSVKSYEIAVAKVAEADRAASAARLSRMRAELDLTDRLVKATIELARQKRIAAGEDAAKVNAESDQAALESTNTTAMAKADAEIAAIRKRIEIATSERDDAAAEAGRIRELRGNLHMWWEYEDPEQQKKARRLRQAFTDKIDEARGQAKAANQRIEDEKAALAAALKGREALEKEISAAAIKRTNEQAAMEKAAAAKAADERSKAEAAAAQAAAQERDRLDRELHQKRMADLREEIAAQKEAAAPLQATAIAAANEFERAFAMYRDPARAKAEIDEERDRAADLRELHKDASRYGGKWRIDELSNLMAAGDTQGVQSRLEDWRKSKSFTPEVEAMVRASAAEQTKTSAEDELRKLNEKTAELTQRLEQLAQSRDGKLDGIERNTNQLANKLDELLTVKG